MTAVIVTGCLAVACVVVAAYFFGRHSGLIEGYDSGYRAGLMHGQQLGTPGNARKREGE